VSVARFIADQRTTYRVPPTVVGVAARERGRLGGRPTALGPAKLRRARKMIGEKTPVTEVAQVLGVSRATLYRRVPELGEARTRPVMNGPDAGVSSSP
jgi:DNA invertase Pin-like site-specific DNA recombinase